MIVKLIRGDDAERTVTVTRNSVAVSIEDAQAVTFTAKRRMEDPDADAVLQKVLGDGIEVAENVATITFEAADTADLVAPVIWFCDVEIVDVAGLTKTVAEFLLRMRSDVTREAVVGS